MKKKKAKNSITPLLLGLSGIVGSLMVMMIGSLTIGGLTVNDGQKQLLGLKESGALPYLKAAEIAATNKDFKLAEVLAQKSTVLGISADQDEVIWPENRIKDEIGELKKQISETPSAFLWLRVAYDQYRLKELDSARESIQEAEKIAPNDEQVKKFILWLSLQRP